MSAKKAKAITSESKMEMIKTDVPAKSIRQRLAEDLLAADLIAKEKAELKAAKAEEKKKAAEARKKEREEAGKLSPKAKIAIGVGIIGGTIGVLAKRHKAKADEDPAFQDDDEVVDIKEDEAEAEEETE